MKPDDKNNQPHRPSDPYYAFDESWGPMESTKKKEPKVPVTPIRPQPQRSRWDIWMGYVAEHPVYAALALFLIFLLLAAFVGSMH